MFSKREPYVHMILLLLWVSLIRGPTMLLVLARLPDDFASYIQVVSCTSDTVGVEPARGGQ